MPKVYENKDWANGYDVIVHNECYAGYTDAEGIDRIVKDHLDLGVGSVMIHCAMHTFRNGKTREWDKLVGVESRRHGAHFAYVVKNLAPEHPITKAMPGNWMTPKGELYHTTILDSATTLAVGYKPGDEIKTSQTCVWANTYQKCRTFGITIGHHNETMQQKVYLDLLTRGLLWSCRCFVRGANNDYGSDVFVCCPTRCTPGGSCARVVRVLLAARRRDAPGRRRLGFLGPAFCRRR